MSQHVIEFRPAEVQIPSERGVSQMRVPCRDGGLLELLPSKVAEAFWTRKTSHVEAGGLYGGDAV